MNKKNPCRTIMQEYAKIEGICTQCFSARSIEGRCQCIKCLGRCRNKRDVDIERYRGYVNNYHKRRVTASLACAIKIFRTNRKLSQVKLAGLLGATKLSVINWEKGKHHPNRTMQGKLMRLGMEIPKEKVQADGSFSNELAAFRKANYWTQPELANLIGTTKRSIVRWEAGRVRPCLTILARLAKLGFTHPEKVLKEAPKKAIIKEKKAPKEKKTYGPEYYREWRKKRLYKKVRNLDLIKHAVQDGKVLK